jgi:hypothetical protein
MRCLGGRSLLLGISIATSLLTFTSEVWGQCGVERWSVKTGTDSAAASIDLNSVSPTTIGSLVALNAPQPIPPTSRVSPTETTVWTLNATLVEVKVENDSDYHLVLSDAAGNTMIGEIPSPNCVDASSPFAAAIAQVRSEFDAKFNVGSSFQSINMPIQVAGVGMFDFLHGQTGVAPNGIELHPILKIDFGGLSISASPSALSMAPGGTADVSVTLSASSAINAPVSFSVAGAPSGVTAAFNPSSLTAPGNSTMTLSVGQDVPPGSYTLTITGTGGASTSNSTVVLAVNAGSSSDFSVSASPAALAVIPGTPVTTTIASALMGPFASDISLSASGLPAGLTASFNPATIPSPGNGSSLLTIAANSTVVGGNVNLHVAASGAGTTHETNVTVNVCTAPQQAPTISRLLSVLPVAAAAMPVRDDDDGRIQAVPSEEALAEARQHGGEPICTPQQSDVFLGNGWTKAANRARQLALAHVTAAVRAPAICGTATAPSPPVVHEELAPLQGDLSDLQIQIRLQKMVGGHQLEVPTPNSIYVVLLAPEIHSKIGEREAGRSYLGYHNHFHAREGEIRYVVVPFDTDRHRQRRTVARAILNLLINPDGPVG